MSHSTNTLPPQTRTRQTRLSDLAKAGEEALAPLFDAFCRAHPLPEHVVLRAAEVGTAMVRGRAGATGAPFNLGEMSVTRMSVRLRAGSVGHGYVQGRSKEAARMMALLDAMAEAGLAVDVDRIVLDPLRAARAMQKQHRAAKAEATKVEFFTMIRGEG